MKQVKRIALASALVLGAVGTAAAGQFQSVPGVTGDVRVMVDNGVATISGHLDSSFERQLAGNYVGQSDGVIEVINLVTFK